MPLNSSRLRCAKYSVVPTQTAIGSAAVLFSRGLNPVPDGAQLLVFARHVLVVVASEFKRLFEPAFGLPKMLQLRGVASQVVGHHWHLGEFPGGRKKRVNGLLRAV